MEAALNSPLGRTVLSQASLKIGRAPDNTVVITDPQSSAHHAEIAPGFNANSYQITDLGSTNGSFVNEQRLTPNTPRPLYAGDVIRIGTTSFTYEASGANYTPTVAASAPNYEPTVSAAPPDAFTPPPQPSYQQQPPAAFAPPAQPAYPQQPAAFAPPAYQQPPAAFNNMNTPGQPPYTPAAPGYPQPQEGYPRPQPAYPQPQPGYGQPGGFSQPGYPPQKKSRVGLWIVLIVIAVLVIGGGSGAYLLLRSTPQKTLAAYCDGWKTNNAQELYNQLDTAQQNKTSVDSAKKALDLLNTPLIGGIKDCTVGNIQQNGSTATGDITITFGIGKSGVVHETLIQENGTWKIDKESNSQPGL